MHLPHYDFYNYPVVNPVRGRTLLLMGMAQDGPVNTPIPCTDPAVARRIFGQEGTLTDAYERAYDVTQSSTIYLMRISGEHATATLVADDGGSGEPVDAITFTTVSGGNKYNGIQMLIRNDMEISPQYYPTVLLFVFPEHLNMQARVYVLADYDNCNELVKAINEDSRAGLNCVIASTKYKSYSPKSIAIYNDSVLFEGGEDGDTLDKNELYLALEYSYQLLEGYYIDYVCPIDARFDDVHPAAFYGEAIYGTTMYEENRDYLSLQDNESNNRLVTFQGQLIKFCKKQEQFGFMTHGILGMNILKDPENFVKHKYSYILRLLEASGFKNRYDLAEYNAGRWYDSGYYCSVVTGELFYKDGTEDAYYENMAVTYAAMLSALSPYDTTTNKPIPNATRLRYQFDSDELVELALLGVVAPRESVRHGIVIANGVTASLPTTEMHSIANVRQVQLTLSYLNEGLDPYIGYPIKPLLNSRTLQDVIENVLKSLKDDGILIDYSYKLEYDEFRGTALVTVDILGKLMTEFVTATSLLTFSN